MKFLCMICAEQMMEHMTAADSEKLFGEYLEFTESIKSAGNYVGGNRLQTPDTAKTVRVRNGKVLTTEGPYAETKEQIGGYYLIDAKDMNEAVGIASRIPGARYGCVEVRSIAEDLQTLKLKL